MLYAFLKRTHNWLWRLYTEVELARVVENLRGDTDTTELMQIAVELKMTGAHFGSCLRPFYSLCLA